MFLTVRFLPEGDGHRTLHVISPDFWGAIEKPYNALSLSLQGDFQGLKISFPTFV
ncbi:MAG: hypothetical protein ACI9G5_000094 [Paracoccaceae bacterium]